MAGLPPATTAANHLTIVTDNPPAAVAGNPFDPAQYTNPSTIIKMTSLRQFCFEHFETHIRASPSRPASHDENLIGFIELITASEPIFARARAVIPELQVPKQDAEIHHENGKIQFLLIATNEMRGPPGKLWDLLPEEAVWRKQREIQAKGQRNANAQDLKLKTPTMKETTPFTKYPTPLQIKEFIPSSGREMVWSPTSGSRPRRPSDTFNPLVLAGTASNQTLPQVADWPAETPQPPPAPVLTGTAFPREPYPTASRRQLSLNFPRLEPGHAEIGPYQLRTRMEGPARRRRHDSANSPSLTNAYLTTHPYANSPPHPARILSPIRIPTLPYPHSPHPSRSPHNTDMNPYNTDNTNPLPHQPSSPASFPAAPTIPGFTNDGLPTGPMTAAAEQQAIEQRLHAQRRTREHHPLPHRFRDNPPTADPSSWGGQTLVPGMHTARPHHSPRAGYAPPMRTATPQAHPMIFQPFSPEPQPFPNQIPPHPPNLASQEAQPEGNFPQQAPPPGTLTPLEYWTHLYNTERSILSHPSLSSHPLTNSQAQYIRLLQEARVEAAGSQLPLREPGMGRERWTAVLEERLRGVMGRNEVRGVEVAVRKRDFEVAVRRAVAAARGEDGSGGGGRGRRGGRGY